MLEINNLRVRAGDNEILRGLSLSVGKGEVHVILGPNGSGKSTLMNVILGHPKYEIIGGTIFFEGEDLTALKIETINADALNDIAVAYFRRKKYDDAWKYLQLAAEQNSTNQTVKTNHEKFAACVKIKK